MKALHLLAISLLLSIAACNRSASSSGDDQQSPSATQSAKEKSEETSQDKSVAADTASTAFDENKETNPKSGNKPPAAAVPKQVIKTGRLQVEAKDFAAFTALVRSQLKQHGGWVNSEEETTSDYQRQNVLEIKVPVDKFDDLMQGLSSLDGKLLEKKIEAEDVTNQVIDIQGRLEAKKQIRARYLELLKQAHSMSDILEVQQQIDAITEDMESAAYNLEHLQREAAVSTIYLTYFQAIDGGYSEPGVISRLWDSVKSGGEGVINLMVGLVAFWPLWVVVAFVIIWWKKRKVTKQGRASNASAS